MMRSIRILTVLSRAIAATAALSLLALAGGCGDDDGGGPTAPGLTTNDMVEVSSGVAVSTVVSLSSLAADVPGLGGDGRRFKIGGRARGALATAWDAAYATPEPCPGGGTVEEACTVTEGVSRGSVSFDNCSGVDEKTSETLTVDGTLSVVVSDPTFCDAGGEVPEGVDASLVLDDFTATLRDSKGMTLERTVADITVSVIGTSKGCAGPGSVLSMNGSITTFSVADGVDATVVADALTLAVSSSGQPCVARLVVDGSLSLTDRAAERHFTQEFGTFALTFSALPNDRVAVTIDGDATVDCLGLVTFETLEPLLFVGGAACPAGGLIQVTLPGGHASRIGFTAAGGVEFDYDADGDVEKSFESCDDSLIKRCPA